MNLNDFRSTCIKLKSSKHNSAQKLNHGNGNLSLPSIERNKFDFPIQQMKKRKKIRKLSQSTQALLRKQKEEIRDAELEKWLEGTGKFPKSRWHIKEKRALKEWFDKLDQDGSGDIDVEELADPLLSSGITKSVSEVKYLVGSFDEDNSGGIGFQEFLSIMKTNNIATENNAFSRTPKKKNNETKKQQGFSEIVNEVLVKQKKGHRQKRQQLKHANNKNNKYTNPIIKLQRLQIQNGNMDINSVLALKRRKLLLDATMGETQRREVAFDEISRWKNELKDMSGISKFRRLHEISTITNKLEKKQEEKQNFVLEMQGMIKKALKSEGHDKPDSKILEDQYKPTNEKMLNQNVIILTNHTQTFRPGGGRRALLYPTTSQNKENII